MGRRHLIHNTNCTTDLKQLALHLGVYNLMKPHLGQAKWNIPRQPNSLMTSASYNRQIWYNGMSPPRCPIGCQRRTWGVYTNIQNYNYPIFSLIWFGRNITPFTVAVFYVRELTLAMWCSYCAVKIRSLSCVLIMPWFLSSQFLHHKIFTQFAFLCFDTVRCPNTGSDYSSIP